MEWLKGKDDKSSYAKTVFPADYWDLRVLAVMLSEEKKRVATTDGHSVAKTSEFFEARLRKVKKDLELMKGYIKRRDFSKLGELIEDECLSIHAVMLTSKPNLIYWLPETVRVMRAIQGWREEGLESYFTINTGQSVLVICQPKDEERLTKKLRQLEGVLEVRQDRIGRGAKLLA